MKPPIEYRPGRTQAQASKSREDIAKARGGVSGATPTGRKVRTAQKRDDEATAPAPEKVNASVQSSHPPQPASDTETAEQRLERIKRQGRERVAAHRLGISVEEYRARKAEEAEK